MLFTRGQACRERQNRAQNYVTQLLHGNFPKPHVSDLLVLLASNSIMEPTCLLPPPPADHFQQVLKSVTTFTKKSMQELFEPSRLMEILIHLRQSLENTIHIHRQKRLYSLLKCVCSPQVGGAWLALPVVFRMVLGTVLWLLPKLCQDGDCLMFLKSLCLQAVAIKPQPLLKSCRSSTTSTRSSRSKPTPQDSPAIAACRNGFVVAAHLRDIVTGLTSFRQLLLQDCLSLDDEEDEDLDIEEEEKLPIYPPKPDMVLSVLYDILFSLPKHYRCSIAELTPFPSTPEYKHLSKLYDDEGGNLSLTDAMERLLSLNIDDSQPSAHQHIRGILQHFAELLQTHKAECDALFETASKAPLYVLPTSAPKFNEIPSSETTRLLCSRMVQKLLLLCRHSNPDVRSIAATCAGRVCKT